MAKRTWTGLSGLAWLVELAVFDKRSLNYDSQMKIILNYVRLITFLVFGFLVHLTKFSCESKAMSQK